MSKHTWDSLAESGHSPKMIEAMLAEQEQEKMSPLRKAMHEVDYSIDDCSQELQDAISEVWDEIEQLEKELKYIEHTSKCLVEASNK